MGAVVLITVESRRFLMGELAFSSVEEMVEEISSVEITVEEMVADTR